MMKIWRNLISVYVSGFLGIALVSGVNYAGYSSKNMVAPRDEAETVKARGAAERKLPPPNPLEGGRAAHEIKNDLENIDTADIEKLTGELKAKHKEGTLSKMIFGLIKEGVPASNINTAIARAGLAGKYDELAGTPNVLTRADHERVLVTTEDLVNKEEKERADIMKAIDEGYTILIATRSLRKSDRERLINKFRANAEKIRALVASGRVIFSLINDDTLWNAIEEAERGLEDRVLNKYNEDQIKLFKSGV